MESVQQANNNIEFKNVNLNGPITQAIANLAILIDERGAEVRVDPMPDVIGDDAEIMQLFQNLIANGIEFCRDRPPKIEIKSYVEMGCKVVQISDNGTGIDPAYYSRIFQMFQRLHSREEVSRTGMGLTICYKIMERHGGSIDVESIVGQGSTFTLRF